MTAVLPPHLVPAEQPKANLVDERGCLHRHGRSLAGKVADGHPVQLVVDEWNQPLERALVAIGPDAQHLRDVVVRLAIGKAHTEGVLKPSRLAERPRREPVRSSVSKGAAEW